MSRTIPPPLPSEQPVSAHPRVTRLSIGRLCNLGNYEHIRYEVTVDIPEGADVAKTLVHIETALNTMAVRPPDGWQLSSAKHALAKPVEALAPHERDQLDTYKAIVRRSEEWAAKQAYARNMLADFGLSSEFTDHKDKWETDQ